MSPKTPVPADASELEEMLLERDTRLGETFQEYVSNQAELIKTQLVEEMQTTLADMVKGVPAGGTGNVTAPGLSAGVTPEMVADANSARLANAGLSMRNAAIRNKLFSKTAMGIASALVTMVPLAAMIAVMRNAWPTSGSFGTFA